jgi:hypothetical protein
MRHVALEILLGALAIVRRRQRGDPAGARVQALRDALDHAALAGGVAALEHDHDLVPTRNHLVLKLDELALQAKQLSEIGAATP